MSSSTQDLQRFHSAQGYGVGSVYSQALTELRTGRKKSHWIWFILPQLQGLGRSPMARRYGITNLEEARAYLADPLLRERLEEVIAVISSRMARPGERLENLMGSSLDAAKTLSSLTLFSVAGLPAADDLLHHLGRSCPKTSALLRTG